MTDYKYSIGEVLYHKDCSAQYQKDNPFIVRKRRVEIEEVQGEEGMITFKKVQYSSALKNDSWFLENSLTPNIEQAT